MDNQTQPEFITVEEAAAILRVNPRHIKRMIEGGKLRARNINASGTRKYWRVLKEDVTKVEI